MIRRTNSRMAVCISLLCLNLAFIWGNSLLPGQFSAMLSNWFHTVLSAVIPFSSAVVGQGDGLLRKLAHFSEFMMLGILLSWLYAMLVMQQKHRVCLSALSGGLAACIDETIQRFIPGRCGCITDVGIDSLGVLTGLLLFFIGYRIIQRGKN